nr:chaperonin-containing-TCP1 theta subunit [Cryptomonas paramecium]
MHKTNSAVLIPILQEGYKILDGIEKVLNKNIEACLLLKKYISGSFGPQGLNKLIKQKIGKILITSDTTTILNNLEYIHPVPKLIASSAISQEKDLGDSVGFIILFTIELLLKSHELLKQGFCLSIIVDSFFDFVDISLKVLEILAEYKIANIFKIKSVASLLSLFVDFKYPGLECYLAPQIAYACIKIFSSGIRNFSSEHIRVIKILGGNFDQTKTIAGTVVIQDTEGLVKSVKKAKIVIFACDFAVFSPEMRCSLVFKTAKEILCYNKKESRNIEEKIQHMAKCGINVIISTGFNDIVLFYMNKYNIMAIKINSKFDIRRIAKTCGATIFSKNKIPESTEIGRCDNVSVKLFGSQKIIIFQKEISYSKIFTIIIRGNSTILLDNIEKTIYKTTLIFKSLTRDSRLVPGGGACEIELYRKIASFAIKNYSGYKQYLIQKYAECFEVIPIVLITNSGQLVDKILSKLHYLHAQGNRFGGVGKSSSYIIDTKKTGVWDLFTSKYWAIKYSSDIAITILLISQIIISRKNN